MASVDTSREPFPGQLPAGAAKHGLVVLICRRRACHSVAGVGCFSPLVVAAGRTCGGLTGSGKGSVATQMHKARHLSTSTSTTIKCWARHRTAMLFVHAWLVCRVVVLLGSALDWRLIDVNVKTYARS